MALDQIKEAAKSFTQKKVATLPTRRATPPEIATGNIAVIKKQIKPYQPITGSVWKTWAEKYGPKRQPEKKFLPKIRPQIKSTMKNIALTLAKRRAV